MEEQISTITLLPSTPAQGNQTESGTKPPGEQVAHYLWVYCLPIIFVVGVCGNIFTILVMRRKRMRGTATSIYLTVMAVADTAVLLTGMIPEWLRQMDFIAKDGTNQWVCKIERFLFYSTGDIAIWMLVAFTCDRFIAVCFPLKKREFCTPQRAKLACLIVFAAAVIKNLHVFWTRGVAFEDGEWVECGKPEQHRNFEKNIRPWLVLALVSLGPFLIILVCNAMIVKELFFSQRLRSAAGAESNSRAFTQTTAMCLSASFAFLVLITPSIVLLIGKPHWYNKVNPNVAYDIAKAISNQLMYVNHSTNFFLYCLTGRRFRDEFVAMFTGGKRDRGNGQANRNNGHKAEYSSAAYATNRSTIPNTPTFVGLRRSHRKKSESDHSDSEAISDNEPNEKENLCKAESST